MVRWSDDCNSSVELLPKIETIKVSMVNAVRITIGAIIEADSGASRLSQHLRNNIKLWSRNLTMKNLHFSLVWNEILVQCWYNDCQVDERSKESSEGQSWDLLQNLESDSLHKMIGNAEAFQKEENESTQGQV